MPKEFSYRTTEGAIVPYEQVKSIKLPNNFLNHIDKISDKNPYALMIFEISTKNTHLIPYSNNEALKIIMNVEALSPDFGLELGVKFGKHNVKTKYSTGLCFTDHSCSWEGYIDPQLLKVSQKEFKNDLAEISGIGKNNVYLEEICTQPVQS